MLTAAPEWRGWGREEWPSMTHGRNLDDLGSPVSVYWGGGGA